MSAGPNENRHLPDLDRAQTEAILTIRHKPRFEAERKGHIITILMHCTCDEEAMIVLDGITNKLREPPHSIPLDFDSDVHGERIVAK